MANVGKLNVSLTAMTGRFGKGMKNARRYVSDFAGEVVRASARLTALSAGAATVAATAIGYLTHKQMEAIDTTAKVADRLGATTEELLGMRHAANLAGVGMEEFDKSQEKLSKNLGSPTEDVADALRKIGLSAGELLSMSPAARFGAIADGINTLGTQAEKAAVAQALFGRTGAQLLNTMDGGSQSIRAYTDEVKKLGFAYSRIDAAKVEEANDAFTKLGLLVDGVFSKIAVEAAPFITELANQFLELGSHGRSAADIIGEGIVNTTRDTLRLVDVVDLLAGAFQGVVGVFKSVAAKWKGMQANIHDIAVNIGEAIGAIDPATAEDGRREIREMHGQANLMRNEAVEAFANMRNSIAASIGGDRSNKAKASFDRIRQGATDRANKAVGQLRSERAATTLANGKNAALQISDAVFRAFSKGNATVAADKSKAFIAETIGSIAGFFRSLPERAIAAGVQLRPVIDPQTSVRGSFSGETAGRMSGSLTIQTKQLEEQRKMSGALEVIAGQLSFGVAIP